LLWRVADDLGKLLGARRDGGSRFGIQTSFVLPFLVDFTGAEYSAHRGKKCLLTQLREVLTLEFSGVVW
jgi:hypothetical protein